MARREVVVLEDDLEGGRADETVRFGLDGVQYEIDLNAANAARMREALATFLKGARKARQAALVSAGGAPRSGSASTDRQQNNAIRAWAKKSGKEISTRGRIPKKLVDEYHAGVAH